MPILDLLIRNGLVVDGSGNPGYYATVGVEGDALHIRSTRSGFRT